MSYLSRSWFWIVILAAILGLHMFGHGRHGWHDGHVNSHTESKPAGDAIVQNPLVTGPGGSPAPSDKGAGK